ncbi:hypothetical protein ACFO26_05945 [Lactococcus nasutitermitis]|uniref:Uncharacterized protein n=1 Tax=Lactococcus nasutitermitis TaxID=1652957 RepID=A0ABV9JDD7_9LACT|nr:hypothetical protein [Lactococcus nasutitermitis]
MTNDELQLIVSEIMLRNPASEKPRLELHAKQITRRKLLGKLQSKIKMLEKQKLDLNLEQLKMAKTILQKMSEQDITILLEDILLAYSVT